MSYRVVSLVLAGIVAAACTSNVAIAADKKKENKDVGGPMLDLFRKLDTEKDGKLSKSEFSKLADVWKEKPDDLPDSDKLFKQLDTNFDGSVTLDEFKGLDKVIAKLNKDKKEKKV